MPKRTVTLDLQYQPLIDSPPKAEGNVYDRACEGDKVTCEAWRDEWIANYKANHDKFGSFAENSLVKVLGEHRYKPSIICGSGPSLKHSMEALKSNFDRGEARIPVVSCLHNFGYFEDNGFHADYYVTLDGGKIIVDDVFESRDQAPEHYWEKTKDKVLFAATTTHPSLFDKWQGKVYFFNSLIPDLGIRKAFDDVERFVHYVSSGGNALGSCFYIAKVFLMSDVIHFVGADFCFDYDDTFHSYKTHYDKVGNYVVWTDVFGMKRKTWLSYLNFKFFFDHVALNIPGRYVNCSEGLLGAYNEGNLKQFQYMSLKDALIPYEMTERVYLQHMDQPEKKDTILLKEIWENPKHELDLVIF